MSNTPELPSDNLISIDDPAIDVAEIMAEIRERIAKRRAEKGYDNTQFPTYGDITYPDKPEDIAYDPNLYHHLHLVNKLYNDVQTEPLLAASPATRVPILGKLWSQIRGQAHNLVIFYVNRAVQHEVEVNRHLVNALNLLTADNQRQQRQIAMLQDEIVQLRKGAPSKERPS